MVSSVAFIIQPEKGQPMNRSDQHIDTYLRKRRTVFNKGFDTFEDRISKDIARIEIASGLLEASELDFFQIAHEHWFGYALPEKEMEKIFTAYLYRSIVPAWASHLARRVLSLYYQGAFQFSELNIN
jgi:hypothetical protein